MIVIDKTEISEDQSSENEDKIDNPDAKWFVVHTLSGQEEKVKRFIENTVKLKGLEHYIVEVIIPTEDVVEMRRGKRRTVAKKFFPSYMIIRMVLMKETEGFIRSVPGITGFITVGDEPVPLSEEEVDNIMRKTDKTVAVEKIEIPFCEGDPVRVIDGPFKDFAGIVSEVNEERGKVRVMVSIFGRLTPVDVDFLQIREDKK